MKQQTIEILEDPTFNTLFSKLTTSYAEHLETLPSGTNVEASRLNGPLYNTLVTPYFSAPWSTDIQAQDFNKPIGELEAHMQRHDITLIDDLPDSLLTHIDDLRDNVHSQYGPGLISERARIASKNAINPLTRLVNNYQAHVKRSQEPVHALFALNTDQVPYVSQALSDYDLLQDVA